MHALSSWLSRRHSVCRLRELASAEGRYFTKPRCKLKEFSVRLCREEEDAFCMYSATQAQLSRPPSLSFVTHKESKFRAGKRANKSCRPEPPRETEGKLKPRMEEPELDFSSNCSSSRMLAELMFR